jgi:hypothetical protein
MSTQMSKYQKLVFFTILGSIFLMLITSLGFTYGGIYYNAVDNKTASEFCFQLAVVNFVTSIVLFFLLIILYDPADI